MNSNKLVKQFTTPALTEKPWLLILTSTFPRHVNDKDPPFVFELARRLTDTFNVVVLTPHSPGAANVEKLSGLTVFRFRYFFSRWEILAYGGGILSKLKQNPWLYLLLPFFFTGQLLALRRLHSRFSFSVIHSHWIIPQAFVAALSRLTMINPPPLVCTSHGGDLFGLKGALLKFLKVKTLAQCAAVTVVSEAMQSYLGDLGFDINKVKVMPMGVDVKALFTPNSTIPRNPKELLFVGRLVQKKGLSVLLEAMPLILNQCPDAKLIVAGSGPEEKALKSLAEKLSIVSQVNFIGAVSNHELPILYQRASIFVAPFIIASDGDQEGLGLVVVEAFGCECPVIASRLPAVADTVIDGATGILAQPNDKYDLASKILYLFENDALRSKLGRNGRKRALELYDWDKVAKNYSNLLMSLVNSV